MRHKKLEYSSYIMKEFNDFFDGKFKVVEVGQLCTSIDMKKIHYSKCPYDGMAMNKQDQPIYLKFIDVKKPKDKLILIQDETIIIDNNGTIYKTNDTSLKTISKGNVIEEVQRIKDFHLLITKNK